MGTLIGGFAHAHGVSLEVGVGFSVRYGRVISSLRAGDALVWVGINGMRSQPWAQLRRRGVRTVYYNTEPLGVGYYKAMLCPHVFSVDEVWDFSWSNIDRCARSPRPRTGKLRYVPPGHLLELDQLLGRRPIEGATRPPGVGSSVDRANGPMGTSRRPDAPAGSELANETRRHLLFFGSGAGRGACLGELRGQLERRGHRLEQTYEVWNESAFDGLMRSHDVYLNLHKECASGGPITFRVPLLLGRGKLILSARAYAADEAEYDGMVFFLEQDRLAPTYAALVRSANIDALRWEAHRRFAERFAPREIFRRAAVFREWGVCGS